LLKKREKDNVALGKHMRSIQTNFAQFLMVQNEG